MQEQCNLILPLAKELDLQQCLELFDDKSNVEYRAFECGVGTPTPAFTRTPTVPLPHLQHRTYNLARLVFTIILLLTEGRPDCPLLVRHLLELAKAVSYVQPWLRGADLVEAGILIRGSKYVLCSMFYVLCSMFYVLCSMIYVMLSVF